MTKRGIDPSVIDKPDRAAGRIDRTVDGIARAVFFLPHVHDILAVLTEELVEVVV